MIIIKEHNKIIVKNIPNFNLAQTLECGQCFRWENINNKFYGVVRNNKLCVYEDNNSLVFENITIEIFENFWRKYFDLDTDYSEIIKTLSNKSEILNKIFSKISGIRILNQNFWEVLCSFVISQNNNIPRIKKIISKMCELFGENLGDGCYSFPSAETIASLSEKDLDLIKSGFRAKYILNAAKYIINNKFIYTEQELTKIKGVGPKIAQCVLLYACHKLDAFPMDVWMKRIMNDYFPDKLPDFFGEYAGVAQQYLYYYYSIFTR